MDRKRELKQQYKQARPKMGIYIVRCNVNNKVYLQPTQDLRTVQNGLLVRLQSGMHPNRELQKEWNEYGAGRFTMGVLEELAYDSDAQKTDYSGDLLLLQSMWEEELKKQGNELYKKRLSQEQD